MKKTEAIEAAIYGLTITAEESMGSGNSAYAPATAAAFGAIAALRWVLDRPATPDGCPESNVPRECAFISRVLEDTAILRRPLNQN